MANIAKINGIVPAKVNGIVPAKVNGMGFSRGLYPYPIPNGVRLNGVDEYLSRTPASAGSRKQWTLSK